MEELLVFLNSLLADIDTLTYLPGVAVVVITLTQLYKVHIAKFIPEKQRPNVTTVALFLQVILWSVWGLNEGIFMLFDNETVWSAITSIIQALLPILALLGVNVGLSQGAYEFAHKRRWPGLRTGTRQALA